jgi:subfamily B ATP-binding cassette protein HlyB/CyaB
LNENSKYKIYFDADEILVLENGRIVEKGSHRELIRKPSSLYYTLWQKQSDQSGHQQT